MYAILYVIVSLASLAFVGYCYYLEGDLLTSEFTVAVFFHWVLLIGNLVHLKKLLTTHLLKLAILVYGILVLQVVFNPVPYTAKVNFIMCLSLLSKIGLDQSRSGNW